MKRKNDDLLRLAFGELSDEAAHAVESGADAADHREIAAFRNLREGLQHLPPPPPDGLSADRLRAAILDGELKSRRAPLAWGQWLFAPVALAALAAVVVLPRMRPRPEVEIVGTSNSVLALKTPVLEFPLPAREERKPVVVAAQVAPVLPPVESRVAVLHRPRRRHATTIVPPVVDPIEDKAFVLAAKNPDDSEGVMTLASRTTEPDTIAAPPSAVVEAVPGAEGRTETVVMVSGNRDLETGAPAATEKEATSVLVGG